MLKRLTELYGLAKTGNSKKLVLAAAEDQNSLEAVINAYSQGLIRPILVGDEQIIKEIAIKRKLQLEGLELFHEPEHHKAAELSVRMVKDNRADILMKGKLSTSKLLKAVLNKEWGLRGGGLLSHLAVFECPTYHKILGLTDAAMNISPDIQAKISIINNSVNYFNLLGITNPKVALLSAIETVNEDIKSSVEAALISKMSSRNQIINCIIDGPLAFDNAINKESADIKGIESPVAGDADILVCDDIDAANILYKSLIYFAHTKCAAVILGAKAPIVLTSRADSDETKLNSIALAAAIN